MESPQGTIDPSVIDRLSSKDQAELQQFIINENQKARIQSSIHSLTDRCFKRCVTTSIRSGKLDKNEEACMQNCMDRFMDASFVVLRHLESLRAAGAGANANAGNAGNASGGLLS